MIENRKRTIRLATSIPGRWLLIESGQSPIKVGGGEEAQRQVNLIEKIFWIPGQGGQKSRGRSALLVGECSNIALAGTQIYHGLLELEGWQSGHDGFVMFFQPSEQDCVVDWRLTGIGTTSSHKNAESWLQMIDGRRRARIEKARGASCAKRGSRFKVSKGILATVGGSRSGYAPTKGGRRLLWRMRGSTRGDFLEQILLKNRRGVDTNIIGTLYLIWRVGGDMRARGREGRILITGFCYRLQAGRRSGGVQRREAFLDSLSFCDSRRA